MLIKLVISRSNINVNYVNNKLMLISCGTTQLN